MRLAGQMLQNTELNEGVKMNGSCVGGNAEVLPSKTLTGNREGQVGKTR